MKNNLTFFLILSVMFYACNNNSNKETVQAKVDTTVATKKDTLTKSEDIKSNPDSVYAYIKEVNKKNDTVFITADYIQFFTGSAAVEAAKKNHAADTSFDEHGKIVSISVDDDYYILNESKKLRVLAVNKNASIQTINMASGIPKLNETSVASFINYRSKLPYILKLKNGMVQTIQEVYLP